MRWARRRSLEERDETPEARRAALVTESLNSNSIDIARALDASVADTAWASYLKGDRGIFTRRAVRLLDVDTVIFDDELSPAQLRNLEKSLGGEVMVRGAGSVAPG